MLSCASTQYCAVQKGWKLTLAISWYADADADKSKSPTIKWNKTNKQTKPTSMSHITAVWQNQKFKRVVITSLGECCVFAQTDKISSSLLLWPTFFVEGVCWGDGRCSILFYFFFLREGIGWLDEWTIFWLLFPIHANGRWQMTKKDDMNLFW